MVLKKWALIYCNPFSAKPTNDLTHQAPIQANNIQQYFFLSFPFSHYRRIGEGSALLWLFDN